jgi:restriction system protein
VTTFLIALGCLLVGWSLGRWRQGLNDNRGEAAVRRLLTARFSSASYHLLNNVTLSTSDGTTQIDHILVSRYGVFVFESKHYTGWIFGNAGAPQWTQVLYKKHYKFQNPIHQNRKHVTTVAKLLEFLPPQHIHSVVVFTGDATFKTDQPPGVMSLAQVESHVAQFAVEAMSENRLQFCVGRLECCRKAISKQTDVEHIAHLTRKFGDAA